MKKLVVIGFVAILGLVGCAHSKTTEADQALSDLKQPPVQETPVEDKDQGAVASSPDSPALGDTSIGTTDSSTNTGPDITPPTIAPADAGVSAHPKHHRRHKHKRHSSARHHKKSRHHAKRKSHRKHRSA